MNRSGEIKHLKDVLHYSKTKEIPSASLIYIDKL